MIQHSTKYLALVATKPNRFFRSLASTVKYILESDGGIVTFPNGQSVMVRYSGNQVDVSHVEHSVVEREEDEVQGLNRVANVVRRFLPSHRVEIFGYGEDQSSEFMSLAVLQETIDPNFPNMYKGDPLGR